MSRVGAGGVVFGVGTSVVFFLLFVLVGVPLSPAWFVEGMVVVGTPACGTRERCS